jgi:hypothetical protein
VVLSRIIMCAPGMSKSNKLIPYRRSKVLLLMKIEIVTLLVMIPRSLGRNSSLTDLDHGVVVVSYDTMKSHKNFRGTCCLHHQDVSGL